MDIIKKWLSSYDVSNSFILCDEENLKVQKEYEEEQNIEHTKIWTEEEHYEKSEDYYHVEEFILNKIVE